MVSVSKSWLIWWKLLFNYSDHVFYFGLICCKTMVNFHKGLLINLKTTSIEQVRYWRAQIRNAHFCFSAVYAMWWREPSPGESQAKGESCSVLAMNGGAWCVQEARLRSHAKTTAFTKQRRCNINTHRLARGVKGAWITHTHRPVQKLNIDPLRLSPAKTLRVITTPLVF